MLLRRVDGNWSLWRSVAIVLIKLIALKEVKNGQECYSVSSGDVSMLSVSTRVNCQPSWRRDKIGPSHQISSFQLSELKGRSSETASSSTKLPEKLYISPQRTPPRFRWIERLPNWPLFSDLLGLWLQTFSVQSQHNQRVRHISMMTFATHKSQRFTWFLP